MLTLRKWKCIFHLGSGKERLYTTSSTNFESHGLFSPHLGPCSWHYGAYTSCELGIKPWFLVVQTLWKLLICDDHPTKPQGPQNENEKYLGQGHRWDDGRNMGLGNAVKKHGKSGQMLYWGMRHSTSSLLWFQFLIKYWQNYFWLL